MATLTFPAKSPFDISRGRSWLLVAAIWTIPGVAALSFYYLNQVVSGQPMSWTFALVSTLPNWYIWALMTPAVMFLAERYPLEQGSWVRSVLTIHVPAMVLLILIHSLANLLLFRAAGLHDTINAALYRVHITSRVHANVLAYWTILGVYHAISYYRALRTREAEAAAVQIQLAHAHLRALKMQLNPHFLFNTLNSITALIRKNENRIAVRMTVKLSDFLRLALENRGLNEVNLRQEVDFAQRYLAIEQIRFGDRLRVELDLAPGTEDLFVPNMLLQPVVENAIHHGVAPQNGPGVIRITSRLEGDRLILQVDDNGGGPDGSPPKGTGVGLSTTRKRLERLYGDIWQLKLAPGAQGGASVRIEIPAVSEPIFESTPEQLT